MASVERRFEAIEKDGRRHAVAYQEWNSDEDLHKPVVICAHGLSRNSHDFDDLAQRISATGKYRVIAFDFVGRGKSDWLAPESKEEYGYPLYVEDAKQLVKHLGFESVEFWIGTSMGGLLALHLCFENPKFIKHLVLNDIGALIGLEGLHRLMTYVGKDNDFASMEEGKEYLKEIFRPFGPLTEEMWVRLTKHTLKLGSSGRYEFHYDPKISSGVAVPPQGDLSLEPFWRRVECPVLLLRGKESDILPVRGVDLMKQIRPDLEVVEFEGVGHAPSLTFDDQIQPIIDFLEKFRREK